jgi:proton-coupled amino acid transporter
MFLDLKRLSYLSMFGLVILVVNLIIIFAVSLNDIRQSKGEGDIVYVNFTGLPLFFGVAVFMFEGDTTALNIEDSMEKPKSFTKMTAVGILFITLMYLLIGIVPY